MGYINSRLTFVRRAWWTEQNVRHRQLSFFLFLVQKKYLAWCYTAAFGGPAVSWRVVGYACSDIGDHPCSDQQAPRSSGCRATIAARR